MKRLKVRADVFETKSVDTAIRRATKHVNEFVEKYGYYEDMLREYEEALRDVYEYPLEGTNTPKALKNADKISAFGLMF